MDWKIRLANEKDIPFIYATWLNSYRNDSFWTQETTRTSFFDNYVKVIDKLLAKSLTIIACLDSDDNVILGYITHEPDLLHYVFVKEAFRRLGIAKSLYKHAQSPNTYSHRTNTSQSITKHKPQLIYNPFTLLIGDIHGST